MVFLWVASWAAASPAHQGAVHIGAAPVEPGTAWAGTGVGGFFGGLQKVTAGVEAGAALGRRGAAHLIVGGAPYDDGGWLVAASGRWLALDHPGIRVAITGHYWAFRGFESRWGIEMRLSPGFALDAGSKRVRVDLSAPLFGLTKVGRFVGPSYHPLPIAGTVGVSASLDPEGRHRLRLGVLEGVSYHHQGSRAYVDLGITVGAVWGKVGVVLGPQSG